MFLHLSVSHSVHGGRGGVCLSACWDTPPGRHHLGQTAPLSSACWGTHTPCPVHAGIDMATAAEGTHPTGMHSCPEIGVHNETWYLITDEITHLQYAFKSI